jgi:Carboxypeptidase regulatory-like domain
MVSLVCALALVLALGASARAQGVQTSVLTGTVTSSDGATLPGATVTVQSPALQGVQSAVTDVNGVFVIRGLPPGQYTVTFEMSGMATIKKDTPVSLGSTVTVDASMAVAGVSETVNVAAETAPVVTNPTTGANYTQKMINDLPVGRTPFLVSELAPGLTDNTPNAGQITIAGSFAYDNVFLMNGVDINDNLFGQNNNLFIEDAVEETQVLTSGISAEYGRFSGGVVNIVTKRGGDTFSGSYRQNLSNQSWTDEVPFETRPRPDKYLNTYEGTFGGPLVRSKLWFFGAGRYADTSTPRTFAETALPFDQGENNKRYEVKVTGTAARNHTFTGSWMDNSTEQSNRPTLTASIDPHTLDTRKLPNDLFVVNYNGVLTSRLFATFQVSQKRFGFRENGGNSSDIHDSPFFSLGVADVPGGLAYNAPYFDETDPEDRNNRQVAGSLSYFLSKPRYGSHDIKGGFEWFRSTNTGGNSQTSTGYVFDADYVPAADGSPLFGSNGRMIPVFDPGNTQLEQWLPTRGARINIATTSFYVHDRWTAGRHWTFDAGLRYERVRSHATGDINAVDTDTIVPRLAATYDLHTDGKVILQATYAHYAGKYSEAQFANNTNVGNPSEIIYTYDGPAGQGLDFAPGFDPANYETTTGIFPTANVFFENGLHSPVTREFTASVGSQISPRLYAKGTYIVRRLTGAIDDFIDTSTGTTDVIRDGVNFGTFDNSFYRNTDLAKRNYQALLFQSAYRVTNNLTVQGHYTIQLQNEGNFEGEASNQPGAVSLLGDYPEVFTEARNFPMGRTDDFQRSKVRLWAIYNMSLGQWGGLDLSGLYRYNSGLTYSFRAQNVPLTDQQLAASEAAGYVNLPNGGDQTLYFGDRGTGDFPGYALVDFGVAYNIPVYRTVRPFVKLDVLNAFNNQKQVGFNTTVTPDFNGPVDAQGLPLNYIKGSRFGQAVENLDYPPYRPGFDGGRTFLMSFGVRF